MVLQDNGLMCPKPAHPTDGGQHPTASSSRTATEPLFLIFNGEGTTESVRTRKSPKNKGAPLSGITGQARSEARGTLRSKQRSSGTPPGGITGQARREVREGPRGGKQVRAQSIHCDSRPPSGGGECEAPQRVDEVPRGGAFGRRWQHACRTYEHY